MQAIHTILLDKTGTITKGKPELTDVLVMSGVQEEEFLRLVAEAERGSEHPLARAIISGAHARGIQLDNMPSRVTALPGQGLDAYVEDHELLIGTRRLFKERLIDRSIEDSSLEEQMERLEGQGKTVMLVACDKKLAG